MGNGRNYRKKKICKSISSDVQMSQSTEARNHEQEADNYSTAADQQSDINLKTDLFYKAISLYLSALSVKPDQKLEIHKSILYCSEQIFILNEDDFVKKEVAEFLIKTVVDNALCEDTTDLFDLFDIHYMLFKAYKTLAKQEEAIAEARYLMDTFAKLELTYEKNLKKKQSKSLEDSFFTKYKSDTLEAKQYCESVDQPQQVVTTVVAAPQIDAKAAASNPTAIYDEMTVMESIEQTRVSKTVIPDSAASSLFQVGKNFDLYRKAQREDVPTDITRKKKMINAVNTPQTDRAKKLKVAKEDKLSINQKERDIPEDRIEIIFNHIYVNGVKADVQPSDLEIKDGRYYHHDATPKFNVDERAKRNEPNSPLPVAAAIQPDLSVKQIEDELKILRLNDEKERQKNEDEYLLKKQLSGSIGLVSQMPQTDRLVKEDIRWIERYSPTTMTHASAVLYQAPLPRLMALVKSPKSGDLSRQEEVDAHKVDTIIQSQWTLFKSTSFVPKVVKVNDVRKSPAPRLTSDLPKKATLEICEALSKLQVTFNSAYKEYSQAKYESAFAKFIDVLLICRQLAEGDAENREIHQQNGLLTAHYIEHLINLMFEIKRSQIAKSSLIKRVDPVKTLLQEEFVYRDPCEFQGVKPYNQPSESEMNHAKLFIPQLQMKPCKKVKEAESKLATLKLKESGIDKSKFKSSKRSMDILKKEVDQEAQMKKCIDDHQFRVDTTQGTTTLGKQEVTDIQCNNPLDLHMTINATLIHEVFSEVQLRQLLSNVTRLVSIDTHQDMKQDRAKRKTIKK